MRKGRIALAVGATVLVAGGSFAWWRISNGGQVTEVSVDEALETFREQATTVASTVAEPTATTVALTPLPEPGVYQYATAGFDQIDALGGARHDYPETTTMTVTSHGCGVRLRWDIAKERWDTMDWCPAEGGVQQVGGEGYHEFFGVAGRAAYTCEGDARPLDAPPGTPLNQVCTADDGAISAMAGSVVDRTDLSIEGVSVPALHVRWSVTVTGSSTGTKLLDSWYRRTDGLLLKEVASIATTSDTAIGRTAFTEESTIRLLSLVPQQ